LGAAREAAAAGDVRAAASGGGRGLVAAASSDEVAARSGDGLAAERGGEGSAGAQRAGDDLRLEAELLDKARRALSRGALQEARSLLGRYAARFEPGVLRPESDVLGIELEMRTGSERAAEAHAARFLASYPKHPLRERVRELVDGRAQRAATAEE
jgi:hypothetical protein